MEEITNEQTAFGPSNVPDRKGTSTLQRAKTVVRSERKGREKENDGDIRSPEASAISSNHAKSN